MMIRMIVTSIPAAETAHDAWPILRLLAGSDIDTLLAIAACIQQASHRPQTPPPLLPSEKLL